MEPGWILMEPGWILIFLHLLGGAAWLGASIFANLVVVPTSADDRWASAPRWCAA
jgi:uncharacterized membrane protein